MSVCYRNAYACVGNLVFLIAYSSEDDSNGDSSVGTDLDSQDQSSSQDEAESELKLMQDLSPQNASVQGGDEVVDNDDVEEDAVIVDVFLVDEGDPVIVKRSMKLKQRLKQSKQHLASSCQVFLSLIK